MLLFTAVLVAATPPTVIVLDLQGAGLPADEAALLSQHLAERAAARSDIRVLTREDLKTVGEHAAQLQAVGCDDVACMAELAAAAKAGLVLTGRLRSAEETTAQTTRPGIAVAAPSAVAAGLPDLTGIADQAVKAVVNISSVQVVRRPNSPFANDPFFEYFFGGRDDMFGSRDQLARSLGSGVLISNDGYVVTNSHVIGSDQFP